MALRTEMIAGNTPANLLTGTNTVLGEGQPFTVAGSFALTVYQIIGTTVLCINDTSVFTIG